MTKKYVAAPGRAIPGGWPEDGRPIDPLSGFERVLVKDGDLVECPDPDPIAHDGSAVPGAPASATHLVKPKYLKKDVDNGQ